MKNCLTLFAILGVMGAAQAGADPAAAAQPPPIDTSPPTAKVETATFALG